METFLKQSSINKDKNCYCIAPFNFDELDNKINSKTGRKFTQEDKNALNGYFKKYSNQKNCQIMECCDPSDSYNYVDNIFKENFIKLYPSVSLVKEKNIITKVILSTVKRSDEGWIEPTPYIMCKVSKSKINDTSDPTIKEAVSVVQDCFLDSCDSLETNTIMSLNDNSQRKSLDYSHTSFDDARVTQAILEGNITYIKTYIRQYKSIDNKLINDDYRNRMIHIAAKSKDEKILKMLLALKVNVDVQNKDLDTPMHLSVRNNRYNNTEELIKMGANQSIANKMGETPIFDAVRVGSPELLRLLFNSGSNHLDTNKNGDTLLNVCILHCPPSNKKVEIVRFLIDKGVNVDNKNTSNKTTLELVAEQLDEENKEKRYEIAANYITNTENFTVNEVDIEQMPLKKRVLLEIQTLVFNAVIRSNADKYNDYINVSEIPKGAPIEVLNHICVGEGNITGNEDSYECRKKGGKVIKIDEPTTKIKLELIPELQSAIDDVNQSELYYQKIQDKIDINKTSRNLEKYNDVVKNIPTIPNIVSNEGNEIITRKKYAREVELQERRKLMNQLADLTKLDEKNEIDNSDRDSTNMDSNDELEHPEFNNEDELINDIPITTMNLMMDDDKEINGENGKNGKNGNDFMERATRILKNYKFTIISILIVIILLSLAIVFRDKILSIVNKLLK